MHPKLLETKGDKRKGKRATEGVNLVKVEYINV
jgi:hypothetical protein